MESALAALVSAEVFDERLGRELENLLGVSCAMTRKCVAQRATLDQTVSTRRSVDGQRGLSVVTKFRVLPSRQFVMLFTWMNFLASTTPRKGRSKCSLETGLLGKFCVTNTSVVRFLATGGFC
jgi:hypothetical protein